ncbi:MULTISPECIES: hypothetical protein [Aquitalea]|uniref:hypothetical protein n=1 Tax=Aquitalea TaxID=407217 RepID=UPI000F58FA5F|nr:MULTISPECIES: hypothetical protein [Aquitalea]
MQKAHKTLSTRLRVTCYMTFLCAIASGFFGIMLAGASASGSGGGQNIIDKLFSIKDVLFIFSAIMAAYLIILSWLESRQNLNYAKSLLSSLFDIFILFVVFLNFS